MANENEEKKQPKCSKAVKLNCEIYDLLEQKAISESARLKKLQTISETAEEIIRKGLSAED
jgi:hypothetical protein